MPTYEITARFWNDFDKLTDEQREALKEARKTFSATLTAWEQAGCEGEPTYPKRLGIKRMRGYVGINELTWAPDGRATWQFGDARTENKAHIIWRRVGTHRIYTDP